ncbi:OB-fold domain-containing protein [soil metagenome]
MTSAATDLAAGLAGYVGRDYGPYRAWDPVNSPMIRQWRDAISAGNDDSVADPDRAPRTMINVWMMRGLADRRPDDSVTDDPYKLVEALRAAGYNGVVATQCSQEYRRDLRAGERISSAITVDRVSELKRTGLGEGYFVTLRHAYSVGDDPVGSMSFTTLHYKPKPREAAQARPAPPQPGISDDTRFFWEGLALDRLLAQRCDSCGTMRHPPGPVCSKCHSLEWSAVELSGRGALYSWTVIHHAAHPAFDYPHTIGLVDLDEGLRIIAPLEDVPADDLAEGLRLEVRFHHVEGEQRLPSFRQATEAE